MTEPRLTIPTTLHTLAQQLRDLGDPSTAETVAGLATVYRSGLLDSQAVARALDVLIAQHRPARP